jgi:hypothetical protein
MLNRMKVTAILPDSLVKEVSRLAGGKTLTESLAIALQDWSDLQKIKELNGQVRDKPLEFKKNYSAAAVRELNRNT